MRLVARGEKSGLEGHVVPAVVGYHPQVDADGVGAEDLGDQALHVRIAQQRAVGVCGVIGPPRLQSRVG